MAGRSSVLALLFAVAAMLVAMAIVPSGASAAFSVANFSYTNSTNQANAHPDTVIKFERKGTENEDIRDIQLDLPAGVFANPEAVAQKCTTAQFNADNCPKSSRVGAIKTTVKAMSLLDLTIDGTIDVVTADPGQVATMGITLRPEKICILFIFCAQPQKIFMKTGVTIDTFDDSQLRTYTPGSPKSSVIGIPLVFWTPTISGDITVNKMEMSFQGQAGTEWTESVKKCSGFLNLNCKTTTTVHPRDGEYFFRNPGTCSQPSVAKVNLISYQNVQSAATASFTATGCNNVPHQSTAFTYNPHIKKYRAPSAVTFNMTVPEAEASIQHALPAVIDADFPLGSGINMEGLAGVTACTETQLRAKACPASSKIGTAFANSKYLPAGLAGDVYAAGSVGNQVPVAVLLRGQAQGAQDETYVIFRGTIGVRGTVEGGDSRAYSRFDRIPQLPFGSFSLTIDKPFYVNPDKCGTSTTTAEITQFSGQTITRTDAYQNTDCPSAPETTITVRPADPTVDPKPHFEYKSSVAGSSFTCTFAKRNVDGTPGPATPFPCNGPNWTSSGTTGSFTSEEVANGTYDFSVYATNQTVPDPTPATASFTLNLTSDFTMTPSISPSTVQAASHPDFSTTVDFTGGQPAKVRIKLPSGFNGSLSTVNGITHCSNAEAAAGICPASSTIGTAEMTSNVAGSTEDSTSGTVYLTEGPTSADAGGIAVKIESPSGTFVAQAGAYLVNNGNNQYLDIRSFPNKLSGPGGSQVDFTINSLTLNFIGSTGFLTAASACGVDQFETNGNAYDGQTAAVAQVALTTVGCDAILGNFTPDLWQTFSSTTAGTTSNDDAFIWGLEDGAGSIKHMTVVEPAAFGANFEAFGTGDDMCPGGSVTGSNSVFSSASCPGAAEIGMLYLYTPLLDEPLEGTVYLINQLPLPWFGVEFNQPGIHVTLTGFTDLVKSDPACVETNPDGSQGYCQKQIQVKFTNLPDVPVSMVDFALMNPPRWNSAHTKMLTSDVLKVSDPGTANCPAFPNNTDLAKATVESHSGAIVHLQQVVEFFGC